MAKLEFKDISFKDEQGAIKATFLKRFYFYIEKGSLEDISDFEIKENAIIFNGIKENKARRKFSFLLEESFNDLKNILNSNKTIYIHKNSGIPLMGCLYFGIIDKGSSMIEVKPITSCNINCIFCSVDEGTSSKKTVDFVVEKDYLIKELRKLIEFKQKKVDIYINPQGEPLLYADIVSLVKDISMIDNAGVISIMTNGTLLTEKLIDDLARAGLNRINLSINCIDGAKAKNLEGPNYNIKHVLDMASYINKKIELVLAPVYLFGINDDEIIKLIGLSKKLKCRILIQNFLYNKRGRNPCKQVSWDRFYSRLKELENIYGLKLILKENCIKTKEYDMPFRKGNIIKPEMVFSGRYKDELIAVSKGRNITLRNCYKKNITKLKITKSKNNIFLGKCM